MSSLTDHNYNTSDELPKLANSGFLFSRFLLATPAILGGAFERSVIFISAHDESGTLGLMINKEIKNVNCQELLKSMGINLPKNFKNMPIYMGGPVDTQRGFILHSADYSVPSTIKYEGGICLSSDSKVLQDYVNGTGPKQALLLMGYCGWQKEQAEQEYSSGAWLSLPASATEVFSGNNDGKWQRIAATNGIDISRIAPVIGTA
jgi:putative transcriptional regulator